MWEVISPHPSHGFEGPEKQCGGPKIKQGKLFREYGYTPGVGAEGTTLALAPLFIIEFNHLQLGGCKRCGVEDGFVHVMQLAVLGVVRTPIPTGA